MKQEREVLGAAWMGGIGVGRRPCCHRYQEGTVKSCQYKS